MPTSPSPTKQHKRRSSFARLLPELPRSNSTGNNNNNNNNSSTNLDISSSNGSHVQSPQKRSSSSSNKSRSKSPSINSHKRRPSTSLNALNSGSSSTWNSDTIDLDAQALERFVTLTLYDQVHLEDDGDGSLMDLMDDLQVLAEDLAEHYVELGHKLCNQSQQQNCPHCSHARLDEIAGALQRVLKETPSLPAEVTAEVHSAMGLLRQKQGQFPAAIQSFLKVLWIQSSLSINAGCNNNNSSSDILTEATTATPSSRRSSNRSSISSLSSSFSQSLNLSASFGNLFALDQTDTACVVWKTAMTKHRLGMAYGRNGQFEDGITMLEKAIADYHESFTSTSHASSNNTWNAAHGKKIVEQAKTALANMQEARALLETTNGGACSAAARRPKRGASCSAGSIRASSTGIVPAAVHPKKTAVRRNKTVDSQAPFFVAASTSRD